MNDRFLAELASTLPRHAAVLRDLAFAVEADDRWRWFIIGCSVSAGRGDERSDLDVGIGVDCTDDDDLPVDAAVALTKAAGPVLDLLVHRLDRPTPHRRIAAQYRSGVQLDLVVSRAADSKGLPPTYVALVDKDGTASVPWRPDVIDAPGADGLREWAFLGWWALGDAAKYLERGSAFEAADRVAEARRLALNLHAAAQGVDYPLFGLTSLLDAAEPVLPMWLEETYGPATVAGQRSAARAAARLLRDGETAVAMRFGTHAQHPVPLAAAVLARLEEDER